jgi:hypothetical protein
MLNLVFFLMLGLFLVGTPVLLYASWADEYFGIIKRTQPRQPQFANWLGSQTQTLSAGEERRVLVLVRGS